MAGAPSLDRTTRRIAGASSLIAGALAAFWLSEFLRNRVPDVSASNVQINIVFWSIVALCFGLVARRRELPETITNAPFVFTLLSAVWTLRFVFKLNDRQKPDFGVAGIVSVAVAIGLVVAAILVRARRDRGAGVEPGDASRRRLTP